MALFTAAFFFRADGADPTDRIVRDGELDRSILVAVPDGEAAAAVAAELQEGGLDLVELYGGLGPKAAAAVVRATGGDVPVGAVGVEEHGPPGERAVIIESVGADPQTDRHVIDHAQGRLTIVFVPDVGIVPAVAAELADGGARRIELCGGMGVLPAAAVIAAVGEGVAVGAVMFGFESVPGAAVYRARYEAALADASA